MAEDMSSRLRDLLATQASTDCCPYVVNLFNDVKTNVVWIQNLPNCGFASIGNIGFELSIAVCQGAGGNLQVQALNKGTFTVAPPSSGGGTANFSVSQIITAGNGNGQLPGGFTVTKS
jgi:hypothetical protein